LSHRLFFFSDDFKAKPLIESILRFISFVVCLNSFYHYCSRTSSSDCRPRPAIPVTQRSSKIAVFRIIFFQTPRNLLLPCSNPQQSNVYGAFSSFVLAMLTRPFDYRIAPGVYHQDLLQKSGQRMLVSAKVTPSAC
jgi:hypothetical protein